MHTCESCQKNLLPYLYELLEGDELHALDAHLESCSACREALDYLKGQQRLVKAAMREAFADVSFQAPKETGKAEAAPTVALPRRTPAPARAGVRYALAASVAVAVLAGAWYLGASYRHKTNVLAQAKDAENAAALKLVSMKEDLAKRRLDNQRELKELQDEIKKLKESWQPAQNQKHVELQKQDVHFIIRKPQSITPGGLNPIQIEMRSQRGAPLPKKVQVAVLEEGSKKKLLTKSFEGKASIDFLLPRDVDTATDLAVVVTAEGENGLPIEVVDHLKSMPEYMTHLATDRPMYRPGDTVRFRSLTLDRFSLKPTQEDLKVTFRIQNPSGTDVFSQTSGLKLVDAQNQQPIAGLGGHPITGIASGQFTLTPDMPGGPYTLYISEANQRFPEEKRRFLVNAYQPPRFNKEFEFHRKSYGAGEQVVVNAAASRVEGGALVQQRVEATAVVDGIVATKQLKTDGAGKVQFVFDIPASDKLNRGEGNVTLRFFDGATVEAIDRPIPIVLNKLFVDFYPEGGDLVEGLPSRVYFQAKTNVGKPADLKGRIVDDTGKEIARAETLTDDKEAGINQGMGLFALTPERGRSYRLEIDSPKNIEGTYALPKAKADGVTLLIPDPVKNGDLAVTVRSAKDRNLLVGAYCRGKLLDHVELTARPHEAHKAILRPRADVGGVYRITVFDRVKNDDGTVVFVPLAERLIFNPASKRLDFAFKPDQTEYTPGSAVKLHLDALNEAKQKTPVIALVSVVDLGVLKLADDKTLRSLPTHFLLTSEIQKPDDLEKMDVLLGEHPKALAALDLLLGTQGWRRFAEQDPQSFQKLRPEEAPRLLMAQLAPRQGVDSAQAPLESLRRRMMGELVAKQRALAAREQEQLVLALSPANPPVQVMQLKSAHDEVRAASEELHAYRTFLAYLGLIAAMMAALALSLGLLWLGVARRQSGRVGAPWILSGAALAIACVVGTLATVGTLRTSPEGLPGLNLAQEEASMPPVLAEALKRNKETDEAEIGVPAPGMAAAQPLEEQAKDQNNAGFRNRLMMPPMNAPALPGMPMPMAAPLGKAERGPVQDAKKGAMDPRAMPKAGAAFHAPRVAAPPANGFAPPMPGRRGAVDGKVREKQMDRVIAEREQIGLLREMNDAPFAGEMMRRQLEAGFGGRANALRADGMPGLGMYNLEMAERQFRALGLFEQAAAVSVHMPLPPVHDPSVLREYAHQPVKKTDAQADDPRSDFTETVFWHPAVVFPDGSVDVSFHLSQATTRFQVLVMAHSADGRIGSKTFEFASKLPFSIQPVVPFEVTATDKIVLPVELKNDTTKTGNVELVASLGGMRQIDPLDRNRVALKAKTDQVATSRGFVTLMADKDMVEGEARITIQARSDFGTDGVTRTIKIAPNGFPVEQAQSGLLEKFADHEVTLPDHWVAGTLKLHVGVFPSTMSDVQKGLEAMLREPGGCFEQTSSANYPNIMILNYMKEADIANPELEKRAKAMIERGYGRLISFECRDPKEPLKRGYEWFGGTAPPHEALTAYGLLQFKDMARIMKVDDEMIQRTEKYLLGQRDGKGSFKRNSRALDTFGRAPEHITNAYIVWALGESGCKEKLDLELKWLRDKAADSKDPYFLALVALAHMYQGENKEALEALKELKKLQKKEGNLVGTDQSITGSRGRDLEVETTALAVLGWLKANRPDEFQINLQNAVGWMNKQRGGMGGFGATQSTILALKALIQFTAANKKTVEAGEVHVQIGDNPQLVSAFPKGASEPIMVEVPAAQLKPGKNRVKIAITGDNALPYTVSWSYQTLRPVNPAKAPVTLTAKLGKDAAAEGETVPLHVTVKNTSGQNQGMAMAIIGLPAGLTIPARQDELKDLMRLRDNDTKPGVISYYEIKGRELILYWRALQADQEVSLTLNLNGTIPGEYSGPASRAYLYYQPDVKFWTDPLKIAIAPNRN